MTTRTRYFVIASLLVLAVGLTTGLLAYYAGFPANAFSSQGGPDELQLVPADASLVAYVEVREIMSSDLRRRVRSLLPMRADGQQEFQNQTGINIDTDIDRVIVAIAPPRDASAFPPGSAVPGSTIVLARGRFDEVKIEALMREHGGQVDQYKGKRVIVGGQPQDRPSISLAFLEPGLVAVGSANLVHTAVDLKSGGANVLSNDEIMNLVRDLETGNAWAVGRFDVLASQARFPSGVQQNLPAVTWFSASATINSGIRGVVRAETRDEDAANGLRDVVRGFMALAKLQAPTQPALQPLLQSLQLGGTGKTVSLSFDIAPEVLDALDALVPSSRRAGAAPR